jgi:hypothetical protein
MTAKRRKRAIGENKNPLPPGKSSAVTMMQMPPTTALDAAV